MSGSALSSSLAALGEAPRLRIPPKLLRLSQLFYTLPDTIPLSLSSAPELDPDDIEDLGYAGALNNTFHRVWGYKSEGLRITERGSVLEGTLLILQNAMFHPSELAVVETWVDALIEAALHVHSPDRYGQPLFSH